MTDPNTGAEATTSADHTPTGVGSWIQLPAPEIQLGPGESRIIDVTFERPTGALAGGLGAVVAEEVTPADESGGIDIRFRIALRVDATADSVGEGLVVEQLELDVPQQFLPRRADLVVVLRNGDPDTIAGQVQVYVDRGSRRFVILQESLTLGPGQRATYEVEWQSVPATPGFATPGFEAAWEGGNLRVAGNRVFILPGWIALALLLLTAYALVRSLRSARILAGRPPPRSAWEPVAPEPDPAEVVVIPAVRTRKKATRTRPPAARAEAPPEVDRPARVIRPSEVVNQQAPPIPTPAAPVRRRGRRRREPVPATPPPPIGLEHLADRDEQA